MVVVVCRLSESNGLPLYFSLGMRVWDNMEIIMDNDDTSHSNNNNHTKFAFSLLGNRGFCDRRRRPVTFTHIDVSPSIVVPVGRKNTKEKKRLDLEV